MAEGEFACLPCTMLGSGPAVGRECGLNERKYQRVVGLWNNQAIRRGQKLSLEVLLSVSRNLFESNRMEDNERGVSQTDNHMSLREEPLHRCLFGLLGNFCTSSSGMYYKFGKVVAPSTWGKQKRMSSIGHIDGIPLFSMPVVPLHRPF
jgi:hypothetical protein